MHLDDLLARLEGVHRAGDGYSARCPGHQDRHASLSVSSSENGTLLLHCHVGCDAEKICAALGLSLADLFDGNGHHRNGTGPKPALTLDQIATAKLLPVEFLRSMGVEEQGASLVFHYLLMNGQRASRQRIRLALTGERRFVWNSAKGHPVPYLLWLLDAGVKSGVRELVLCEGETDGLTLAFHDVLALGIPGADLAGVLQAAHMKDFDRALIVREDDHGGEVFEKGLSAELAKIGFPGQVAVIEMQVAGVKDISDLHLKLNGDKAEFAAAWAALKSIARPLQLPVVGLEITESAVVETRPVRWLWPRRIPLGKLVLFAGAPGLGKSFVALYVAARASSGADWPDGARNGVAAKSLIFSAEDSAADTIVPRLEELCAEKGRVFIVGRVKEADPQSGEIIRRQFNIRTDLPQVEKYLDKHPDAKLIVVDPVSSYMAGTDSHKNSEVRSDVLDKLAELAERRDVTVLAISHLNKASGSSSALDRVSGSIAFPAAARAVWIFTDDRENLGRRLMLAGKNNLAPEIAGLAFRIVAVGNGRATVEWCAGEVTQTYHEFLEREAETARESVQERKLDRAIKFVEQELARGPMPAKVLAERAKDRGIGSVTLRRARGDLHVRAKKVGTEWILELGDEGSSGRDETTPTNDHDPDHLH